MQMALSRLFNDFHIQMCSFSNDSIRRKEKTISIMFDMLFVSSKNSSFYNKREKELIDKVKRGTERK